MGQGSIGQPVLGVSYNAVLREGETLVPGHQLSRTIQKKGIPRSECPLPHPIHDLRKNCTQHRAANRTNQYDHVHPFLCLVSGFHVSDPLMNIGHDILRSPNSGNLIIMRNDGFESSK